MRLRFFEKNISVYKTMNNVLYLSVSKKFLPLHPQSRNKHWFERAKSRNATTGWPVRLFSDARIHCNSFCFVSSCTKFSNSISHGLTIISVITSKKNKELKNRLVEMANHKSSLKRIRQEETRRLHKELFWNWQTIHEKNM